MSVRIDEYGHIIRDDGSSNQHNLNPRPNNQAGTSSNGSTGRPRRRKHWGIWIIVLLAAILIFRSCSSSQPKRYVEIPIGDTAIEIGETIEIRVKSSTDHLTASYDSDLLEFNWNRTAQENGAYYAYANVTGLFAGIANLKVHIAADEDVYESIVITIVETTSSSEDQPQDSSSDNNGSSGSSGSGETAAQPKYMTVNVPGIKPNTIMVDPIVPSSFSVESATILTGSGNISFDGQSDSYTFEALYDGVYRADLSGMQSGTVVELYIYDSAGNRLASDTYCQNNEGATAKGLSAGNVYEVRVVQRSGYSSYQLTIGLQKQTIDISNLTELKDSLEYADQRNVYTFTAPIDGRYRFELSEMMSGTVTELYVFNDLNETLASDTYCQNGEGVTLKGLEGGKTYEVQVRQDTGFSGYRLAIGLQKQTIDISDLTELTDSIEYTDQRNVYTYTVPIDGRYRFELSEMMSGTVTELYVFNDLNETLASDTYCQNGEGVTLKGLEGGKTYEVQVRQDAGFSSYHLSIGSQKETVDIENLYIVTDSIEYTDQRNVYSFSASVPGDVTFTISGMKSGTIVELYAFNDLGETVASDTYCQNGESIMLKGVPQGTHYEIQVRQRAGGGEYTLTVD